MATSPRHSERAPAASAVRLETWLTLGVVLAGLAPALWLTRSLYSPSSVLAPDAVAHAVVAQAIGTGSSGGGWTDVYNGGFPLGPHYQMPAILVAAGLVRLGVHATTAVQAVGLMGSIAAPMVFAWAARSLGARWFAAATGALLLAWQAPFYAFIGGFGPHLAQGLVSQAFAVPIVMAAAWVVLAGRPRSIVPLMGALAAASHAQISVAALVVGACAVPFLGREALRRFGLAAAGALVFGVALYGPGLLNFAVPFGWAKVPAWRIIGHSPRWMYDFLSRGELLDSTSVPIVTGFGVVAAVICALTLRRAASRAALSLLVVTLLGCIFGSWIAGLGWLGRLVVEVVSPVRLLVLLPIAIATASVVAIQVVASMARASWMRWTSGLLPLVAVGTALPDHVRTLSARANLERSWSGASECGESTPDGWNTQEVRSEIARLERGRFVLDWRTFPDACAALRGVELSAHVPLGDNMGGPGTQVGVLSLAFGQVRLGQPGSAARAEALGVRSLLTLLDRPGEPGFATRYRRGRVALLERESGTDLVGVGCVGEVWKGPDRALRDALFDDLSGSASSIESPLKLVALEAGEGPVQRYPVDAQGCDATRARVSELPSARPVLRAEVDAPAPVDVVFRATDFPTWRVTVDDATAETRRIAPGFFSVRVGPGRHVVAATVRPLAYYVPGLGLAALVVVFLGIAAGRRSGPGRQVSKDSRKNGGATTSE